MASAGDENQPPRAHVHRFAIPLQAVRGQRITFRIMPGQVNKFTFVFFIVVQVEERS